LIAAYENKIQIFFALVIAGKNNKNLLIVGSTKYMGG